MLENITLDSVLKDYYFSIDSKKLSEDNISINEELEISDSSEKYVIRLAKFLNESYYKGYIISSSILSKLMDIIEYKGYEYQVLESYINILNDSMNNHLEELECKPDFENLDLTSDNCISFVTEYSKIIKDISDEEIIIKNNIIPHFKEPSIEEPEFELYILKEIQNPIQFIYNDIKTTDYNFNKTVEVLYSIYKNDSDEFLYIVQGFNSEELFFLLNEKDYDTIDICMNNIRSLNDLRKYIRAYYMYTGLAYNHLTDTMIENIRRIFTIITINFTVSQLAVFVSEDYKFWEKLNSDINVEKLYDAIILYEENPKIYKVYGPLDIIHSLDSYHIDDRCYIARYILLNMDYKIFCDNFLKIVTDFYNTFTIGKCYELIDECLDGLILLNTEIVNNELLKLYDTLKKSTIDEDIMCICDYTCDIIYSRLKE